MVRGLMLKKLVNFIHVSAAVKGGQLIFYEESPNWIRSHEVVEQKTSFTRVVELVKPNS